MVINPFDLKTQFEQDLEVLYEVFSGHSPLSPQKVRVVAAATVRKWLLDGQINHLAKQLEVTFELPAYDATDSFDAIARGAPITYFLVGGVQLGGTFVRSMYASSSPASPSAPLPISTQITLHKPGKFLVSKRLYHEGTAFTAEQVLSFVANKSGGVHFDPSRTALQAKLEAAAAYMTFGNPNNEAVPRVVEHAPPGGPCTIVIPSERGNLWSALEIELLAAAQSLVSVHCNGAPLIAITK